MAKFVQENTQNRLFGQTSQLERPKKFTVTQIHELSEDMQKSPKEAEGTKKETPKEVNAKKWNALVQIHQRGRLTRTRCKKKNHPRMCSVRGDTHRGGLQNKTEGGNIKRHRKPQKTTAIRG